MNDTVHTSLVCENILSRPSFLNIAEVVYRCLDSLKVRFIRASSVNALENDLRVLLIQGKALKLALIPRCLTYTGSCVSRCRASAVLID